MQGNYDKIVALINRNNAIKKAVNKANASTIVSIGGEQMTVAEAIYRNPRYRLKRRTHRLCVILGAG